MSLSRDVHPRTALEELIRLGAVTLQDDLVCVDGAAFVPRHGFEDMVDLLTQNVADHIAAGTHNLGAEDGGRFLEQSVFAASLTPESAAQLGGVAREIWAQAFERMVAEANARVALDRQSPTASRRMRFGVFYYADILPGAPAEADAQARPPATGRRGDA